VFEFPAAYREPLLRNDREINNETTAVAIQRLAHSNRNTAGSDFFCVVRSETMIQPTEFSSVSEVQLSAVEYSWVKWVGEQSGGLL
jgi:hypothetical protein